MAQTSERRSLSAQRAAKPLVILQSPDPIWTSLVRDRRYNGSCRFFHIFGAFPHSERRSRWTSFNRLRSFGQAQGKLAQALPLLEVVRQTFFPTREKAHLTFLQAAVFEHGVTRARGHST